jgi:Protein of unknown function (DUF2637)
MTPEASPAATERPVRARATSAGSRRGNQGWTRVLTLWNLGLVVLAALAAGAFTVSFHALSLGAAHHGIPADLSWILPLLFDGGQTGLYIIVLARAQRGAKMFGEDGWVPWAGIVALGAASLLGNVSQAPGDWGSKGYAAAAPAVLILFAHVLAQELRKSVIRQRQEPADRARSFWLQCVRDSGVEPTLEELMRVSGLGRRRCEQLRLDFRTSYRVAVDHNALANGNGSPAKGPDTAAVKSA